MNFKKRTFGFSFFVVLARKAVWLGGLRMKKWKIQGGFSSITADNRK